MTSSTKICDKCSTELSLDFFQNSKTHPDNKKTICRTCFYKKHKTNKNYRIRPPYKKPLDRVKINKRKKEYYYKKREKILADKQKEKAQLITVLWSDDRKICNKCNYLKILDDFSISKKGLFNRKSYCKKCDSEMGFLHWRKNLEINRIKNKEYSAKNREIINQRKQRYRQTQEYKNWREKYRNQEQVKIADRLRAGLRRAINYGATKEYPSLKYLGCELENFITYLKSQLTPDMTWDMLMSGKIVLDHISPLCAYDLTKQEELKKVCYYKNIRPLFQSENSSKATEDKKLKFIPK